MHTFHTHEVQQGSDAWHALRAKHFTASEAPAMLGMSPYTSRNDLLKQKAFGAEREIDWTVSESPRQRHLSAHISPLPPIVGSPPRVVVALRDRTGLPVVVLVDGTSASASAVSSMHTGRMKTPPSAMLRERSTA